MFDCAFDDLAVDVQKSVVVIGVGSAFPSDVEVPLTEIGGIVFEILNSSKSGEGREVTDRVSDKSGNQMLVPLEQFFILVVNHLASSLKTSLNLLKSLGGVSSIEMSCHAQIPT